MDERLKDISLHISYTDYQPFRRMLVRLKKEIISLGMDEIRPAKHTGRFIEPKKFKQWLDEGKEVLVLDARNDYELRLGTFENAIDQLVNLEKETLDTQNDFKLFYSKLTLIAKEYLENDIEISASESTTTQLIDKIYLLNNSKKINISDDIIESFKTVLNNADLVKFAKFTPQNKAASDDNKFLKSFIVNTKKSIPNNIEQEDEQKRIIELRFNEMIKKRKIKYSLLSIITLLITFLSLIIVLFGPPNFQSLLTFDSDKKILKQQWVSSVYTGLNLSLEKKTHKKILKL